MSYPGVEEAHAALVAALESVEGLTVYGEPEDVVDPPCAVLGPPDFSWEGHGPYPAVGTWTIAVVITGGTGHAMADLFALLPPVSEALEATVDCVITSADAGTFRASSAELPAYFFRVEVAL